MKVRSSWLRVLWPVSILYSLAVSAKSWCYARGIFRTRRLPGIVISVGNLTVGGTGKTPMVLALAERLAEQGSKVAILTRGYKGAASGEAGRGEPQSDEVSLLRERLEGKVQLGVGADRYQSGAVLARHGIDTFLLDDGFQHVKLARDVNVVLLDATDPFGGGRVLPAGRLREPLAALRRADILVITRSVQEPSPAIETVVRRYTASPIFYTSTQLNGVLRIPRLDVPLREEDWKKARFFAFCAIGNPIAFFGDLRQWGFQVAGERGFADHHSYPQAEAAALEKSASDCGADALLCTEKDIWNLRKVRFSALPVYCARISFELPPPFWNELARAMQRSASAGKGE